MAATQPVLGGTTLPHPKNPDGFEITERTYRGGILILADGSAVVDLVSANAKHTFRLVWENITSAEWATVQTAFATIDDGSATFTAPNGSSYTVTRDPSAPGLSASMRTVAGGNPRWSVTMTLREV